MSDVTVTQDEQRNRFEAHLDGTVAGFIDYYRDGVVYVMPHTEVDPSFGGRGVGGALVRGALDMVREQGGTVRPLCSFVAAWIEKHPDYADLVA